MNFRKLISLLITTFLICSSHTYAGGVNDDKNGKKASVRKPKKTSEAKSKNARKLKSQKSVKAPKSKAEETKNKPVHVAPIPSQPVHFGPDWKGDFRLANGMVVRRTKLGIALEKDGERVQHSRVLKLESGRNLKGAVFQSNLNLTKDMTAEEFMAALSRESEIVSQSLE